MELVVRKPDFLRELQLLQNIVERKITIPILANILVEAQGETLKLMATDLELGLRTECQASVSTAGTMTLPAKKLFELVRELPDADVRIEQDASTVKIAADRFESRFSTLPPEDYPTLPASPEGFEETFAATALRQMIGKTSFAITGEDTRYFLNGALLLMKAEELSLVATDGHRLALVTVKRDGAEQAEPKESKRTKKAEIAEERREILPKKTLGELDRLLRESSAAVRFARTENHLFFEAGQRLLVSRKIDGQFPAFDRVIPRNNDKKIDFERERFARAIRRVALLSSERSRAVRFQIDKGQVEVMSSSPEVGEAKEVLIVEYDGPSLQVCFNAQYVSDFLAAVETEQVTLEFKDEVSQAVMKPVAPQGYDYLYVIMPMRL
jgi:DNA polymerase-3 subunit beta